MGVYTFEDVSAVFIGPVGFNFILSAGGIADEGITTAMVGEKNTMQTGANGDIQHSLHASNAGRMTVRLLKTGVANAVLSQIYNFQKTSGAYWGQNKIVIRNPITGDIITGTSLAFVKQPDVVYAKEGGIVEWAFDGNIDELLGTGTPTVSY